MPLDINLFRAHAGGNPDVIRESQRRRYAPVESVDEIINLDNRWRYLTGHIDDLKKQRNATQKVVAGKKKAKEPCDELVAEIKTIEVDIAKAEAEQTEVRAEIDKKICKIGNIVDESVPVDNNEDNNAVVRTWGTPRDPTGLLNHHDLLWRIGGYEPERGVSVAGHRGYFLRDVGVLLNQAFINYGIAFLRKRNYTVLQPPFMMKKDVMSGVAQLEQFDEELYKIVGDGDDKYLIATSEQPICGYHMGEWIEEKSMPIRYAGISTCFRKEAGAHGKDTWGIFRVHQFEKVEQFIICEGDLEVSKKMQDEMIQTAEEFYQSLGFPYHVINIVSGALNNAAIKKLDLEAWFPGYNAYRELVSCSNCTDYQSRSMEIRSGMKRVDQREKKYVHMLNATLCATGRAICCLLENYQEENGVRIPEVLVPFMGGIDFLPFVRNSKLPVAPPAAEKKASEKKPVKAVAAVEAPTAAPVEASSQAQPEEPLVASITAKGDEIRNLKAMKGDKEEIKKLVDELNALKLAFKEKTGQDYPSSSAGAAESSSSSKKAAAKKTCDSTAASKKKVDMPPPPPPCTPVQSHGAAAAPPTPVKRPAYTSAAPARRFFEEILVADLFPEDVSESHQSRFPHLLDKRLRQYTYVGGPQPTIHDNMAMESLGDSVDPTFAAVHRWLRHIKSFSEEERKTWV